VLHCCALSFLVEISSVWEFDRGSRCSDCIWPLSIEPRSFLSESFHTQRCCGATLQCTVPKRHPAFAQKDIDAMPILVFQHRALQSNNGQSRLLMLFPSCVLSTLKDSMAWVFLCNRGSCSSMLSCTRFRGANPFLIVCKRMTFKLQMFSCAVIFLCTSSAIQFCWQATLFSWLMSQCFHSILFCFFLTMTRTQSFGCSLFVWISKSSDSSVANLTWRTNAALFCNWLVVRQHQLSFAVSCLFWATFFAMMAHFKNPQRQIGTSPINACQCVPILRCFPLKRDTCVPSLLEALTDSSKQTSCAKHLWTRRRCLDSHLKMQIETTIMLLHLWLCSSILVANKLLLEEWNKEEPAGVCVCVVQTTKWVTMLCCS